MQFRLGKFALNIGRAVNGSFSIPVGSPMSSLIQGMRSAGSWGFPSEKNKQERLAAYTGYVHSCVSARAQRDAAAKYNIYDRRTGDLVPEDKAPIPYSFFRKPNPVMSEFFFKSLICTWVNLTGTAPVLKVRNAAGIPIMQWPLLPNRVTALYDPVDWVRYEYLDDNGNTVKIPGKDIIFYRWPHPTKMFDGLGPLEGAGLFHDTDVMLWQYQREMFSKGPFASWVLQYPADQRNMTPDTANQIAENFEQIVGDRTHPAYPVVLTGGAEAKQFPVSNKGMEVPTINEEIKERIRSAFHVSKTILGEVPGESRANVEGAEYGFYRFTEAYLRMIDEENERSVLPEWDERYVGDFEMLTPQDKDFKLREETADITNKVMTINEVRERRGLVPVEWGAAPWGSFSDTQLNASSGADEDEEEDQEDSDMAAPAADGAAPAAAMPDVQATALNGAQVDSLMGIVDKITLGSMSKETGLAMIQIAFPSVALAQAQALINGIVIQESEQDDSEDTAPEGSAEDEAEDATEESGYTKYYKWEESTSRQEAETAADIRRAKSKAFVDFQEKYEKKVLKELRDIFAKEEKAVLAKVEKYAPRLLSIIAECRSKNHAKQILKNRSAIDDIAAMEEFAAEYERLKPYLLELYTDAGTQAAKGFGVTFEVNKLGLEKIANHLKKSIDAILQTTSEAIRDALQEGFLEGEGIADLGSRIREIYDGMSRHRAELIARTETVAPANDGAVQGYKQAGVTKKEWITTMDGHARDAHDVADGQVVGIDEPFIVDGEALAYPGADNGSAKNVINCRCAVAGIMED